MTYSSLCPEYVAQVEGQQMNNSKLFPILNSPKLTNRTFRTQTATLVGSIYIESRCPIDLKNVHVE